MKSRVTMAEAPRRTARRSRSRSRSCDEQPTRASRSRDEQPTQSRGRFGSRTVNITDRTSSRASTAPSSEWLSDAHAHATVTNELTHVKQTYASQKKSLAGGRRGDAFAAWKQTLRAEGVKLMRQVRLVKRISSTAASDAIRSEHVHSASEAMRITRLPSDGVNVVLRPSPGTSLAEIADARFLQSRVSYPNHASGVDWVRWTRVTGMEKTKLLRLAHAVFGRAMTMSPGAQRVFVMHLRCFIEAVVPVFAKYAREDADGRGTKVTRELIELAAESMFSF
jgi:hypothetical protein